MIFKQLDFEQVNQREYSSGNDFIPAFWFCDQAQLVVTKKWTMRSLTGSQTGFLNLN